MPVKEQIFEDLKNAMKAKDQGKLRVLRSLKAKLMEAEIAERKGAASLSDQGAIQVITKVAKQRKESIDQFMKGGRGFSSERRARIKNQKRTYELMSEDEVRKIVEEKLALGASGPQDMGKVMGPLMGQLRGKADGSLVSKLVKNF